MLFVVKKKNVLRCIFVVNRPLLIPCHANRCCILAPSHVVLSAGLLLQRLRQRNPHDYNKLLSLNVIMVTIYWNKWSQSRLCVRLVHDKLFISKTIINICITGFLVQVCTLTTLWLLFSKPILLISITDP